MQFIKYNVIYYLIFKIRKSHEKLKELVGAIYFQKAEVILLKVLII